MEDKEEYFLDIKDNNSKSSSDNFDSVSVESSENEDNQTEFNC